VTLPVIRILTFLAKTWWDPPRCPPIGSFRECDGVKKKTATCGLNFDADPLNVNPRFYGPVSRLSTK
jgi:hypothetical protein